MNIFPEGVMHYRQFCKFLRDTVFVKEGCVH